MPEFFKKDKLPKRMAEVFRPDGDFLRRDKEGFLFAARRRFGSSYRRHFSFVAKGLAAAVVMFVAVSSLSAYADARNVGPTSVLYPLKRYSEAVRVVFASGGKKQVLQLRLAKRRADEYKELSATSSSLPVSPRLVEELKHEAKRGFIEVGENGEDGRSPSEVSSYCGAFKDLIDSQPDAEEILGKHPKIADHFQEKCSQVLDNVSSSVENGASGGGDGTKGNGSSDNGNGGEGHRGKNNGKTKVEEND